MACMSKITDIPNVVGRFIHFFHALAFTDAVQGMSMSKNRSKNKNR